MLTLILGRAKTGKTADMMERIRTRAAQGVGGAVVLVPEQYSHEAETELLAVCGDSASLFAEVLSFTRLAARVEGELGGACRAALSRGGRLLCLVRALGDVGSRLAVYGAARRQAPLQQELLRAIDEFKTCRISPDALREYAEGAHGELDAPGTDALRQKLGDLALIYDAYQTYADRSGLDPMDRLTHLAERIGESAYTRCAFFVDGFTDFTAQELAVLGTLLRAGAEVRVCLTAEGLSERHEIFEPSRRAALRLAALAAECGAEWGVERFSGAARSGPMADVEREAFSFAEAHCEPAGALALVCAPDTVAECEWAAARCLELVRTTGCRWRDIAVTARSFETYRGAMESVFAHYGVPLYTAKRSALLQKPLPALVAAAYDTVTGGWDYEDVFAYLKTGLAGLSRAECDTLENYVFLWSLRGADWTRNEDWVQHPAGFGREFTDEDRALLAEINALRRRASAPLLLLAERGGVAKTGGAEAQALADFFAALELPRLLTERAAELRALGQTQTAAEYAQLWDIVCDALTQCGEVLRDTETDLESFGKLFTTVLSSYDVGTIPLSLDRVSAGDFDRMRRRHIRHLIMLGCDSASVPAAAPGNGILSDADREALAAAGLDVGSAAGERLDREFALLYNCLTLPSDTLAISWCALGAEGAKASPAFAVERLRKVFDLPVENVDSARCRESAPGPAFELAAAASRPFHPESAEAARRWFSDRGAGEALAKLDAAASLTRGRLSRSAVRALYGEKLTLSASRIDNFSGCPFSYFLQYGLKAKPRQPAEFAPPEMGTFMHFVLEGCARSIAAEGGFASVSPERVEALCDEYVARYVHEKLNDFRQKSPRFIYLFRRLTGSVRAVVTDMAAELGKSDFQPLDFELNFGDREAFPPIALGEGEDSLVLTGIADRVDGWVHDGRLYLRVVDYKTGKKSFSLSDVWYGLGLQMLLYLFALERSGASRYGMEIVPAGVLYVPARDVLVSAPAELTAEQIMAEKAKARRRSGLLLGESAVLDAMEHGELQYLPVSFKDGTYSGDALASAERLGALGRHIDATLRALARELRGGSVAADPWFRSQTENACRFCDYAAACHFDESQDSMRYIETMKPGEVWDRIEKEAADHGV